jgi:hypothetical protein
MTRRFGRLAVTVAVVDKSVDAVLAFSARALSLGNLCTRLSDDKFRAGFSFARGTNWTYSLNLVH